MTSTVPSTSLLWTCSPGSSPWRRSCGPLSRPCASRPILERAGDYAVHIAKVARRRHPAAVLPEQLRATVQEMGERAAPMTSKAGEVIGRRDLALAQQLLDDDEAFDALHRQLFAAVLDDPHDFSVEKVVDITLVGRYYERLADHAVAVSRAVGYLVTGRHSALTA